MTAHRIALIPGDGIGPEVTSAAVRVLEALPDCDLVFNTFDWGCEHHERHGTLVPDDFLEVLRPFDAILLGAVGWPARLPDHVTIEPLLRLRQAFDQYACVRPARLMKGIRCPLAEPGDIDMVVVRENSEGEYVMIGGRAKRGTPDETAIETAVHTRRGIERVLRFGFELARTRRRRLTMATKSNALKHGFVLWDEVHEEVAADYADVATGRQHIDALAMNLLRTPDRFDVIVGSNLFGDILTDLSGAITGSLGLNPSANLNPPRDFPSLFEPVHGSAPDIAGRGIANPVGAVLSAAMMLDWLGETGPAARVTAAVEGTLADGCATADLGGSMGTAQMTDAMVRRLEG